MYFKLVCKDTRRELGRSQEFKESDWSLSNEDDWAYNLIPIVIECTEDGFVFGGNLVFDKGRQVFFKFDTTTPENKVWPGLKLTCDPRTLKTTSNNWRRGIRGGTVGAGVALGPDGYPIG